MTSRLRALKASNLILGLANLDYELLEKVADIIEVEIDAALDVVKDDVDAAVAEERDTIHEAVMDCCYPPGVAAPSGDFHTGALWALDKAMETIRARGSR